MNNSVNISIDKMEYIEGKDIYALVEMSNVPFSPDLVIFEVDYVKDDGWLDNFNFIQCSIDEDEALYYICNDYTYDIIDTIENLEVYIKPLEFDGLEL